MLIEQNKPVGSLEDPTQVYDDDGNMVEYTDAMYRRDLRGEDQVKNPFLWLYKDYERKQAQYKVVSQMGLKFVLIVPVVLVVNKNISLGASLAIVSLFAGFATYSAPFLNNELDFTESVSRITMVISAVCALMLNAEIGPSSIWSLTLTLANILSAAAYVAMFLYSLPAVKLV